MNDADRANNELPLLLSELVDGQLEPAAAARLTALLRDDPAARTRYLQFLLTEAMLRLEYAGTQRLVDAGRGAGDEESGVRGQESGSRELGTSLPTDLGVESRDSRVESGERNNRDEWRLASETQRPKTQDPSPDFPIINLQISKSANLQTPRFSLPSPLSSLPSAWAFSYSVATVFLALALLGAWSYSFTHPSNFLTADAANSGSVTHTGNIATEPSELTFVGHVKGMFDCRWSDPTTETYPGAGVTLGRRYALKSGLLEIEYTSGAKVILQGPCDYKVESARSGYLQVGKLVARVSKKGEGGREKGEESAKPQAAVTPSVNPKSQIPNPKSSNPQSLTPNPLFFVRTPTAVVTDLGTEFGVEVSNDSETASHVFQGKVVVKIEGAGSGGRGTGDENAKSQVPNPKSQIILSAGQSARVERLAADGAVVLKRDTVASGGFVRNLPRQVPIKLFNTGIGLKEGDPDPHWQIAACSDDPDFKPRPAVVTSLPFNVWLANDPRQSQWISTADGMPNLPQEITYTFRTTFELADALPNTAVIQLGFIADNCVRAIRLNGRKFAVPEQSEGPPYDRFRAITIREGFIEGTNVLEIDVFNGDEVSRGIGLTASGMALRVKLEGAAWNARSVVPVEDPKHKSPKEGTSMK